MLRNFVLHFPLSFQKSKKIKIICVPEQKSNQQPSRLPSPCLIIRNTKDFPHKHIQRRRGEVNESILKLPTRG